MIAAPAVANSQAPATAEFDAQAVRLLTEAGAEDQAALIRCGGLYRALSHLFGAEGDAAEAARAGEADMLTFAAMARQVEDRIEIEDALVQLEPIFAALTDLYRARLIDNHARIGTMLDAELREEIEFCTQLRGEVLRALQ